MMRTLEMGEDATMVAADSIAPAWEIERAVRLLEDCGYLVRKPEEVRLPVKAEVIAPRNWGDYPEARLSIMLEGRLLGIRHMLPLNLGADRDRYREVISGELAAKFSHAVGDHLRPQIDGALARLWTPETENPVEKA